MDQVVSDFIGLGTRLSSMSLLAKAAGGSPGNRRPSAQRRTGLTSAVGWIDVSHPANVVRDMSQPSQANSVAGN
jgi:hypothetical protein